MIDTITCWTPDCVPPVANILNLTDNDCFGASNGSVTVEANGTYPPFEYMITGVDTNSTGIFQNLSAGDYTVLILDDVNCPQSVQLSIGEPAEIESTEVLINNAACNGGTDGSVTVTLNGGTAPYNFSWSNGQTDSIAIDLAEGEYFVTIEDALGCSTIDTVNVVQPPVLSLSTENDSVSCNGQADGTATVLVAGGVGPYTYQWDANTGNQTDSTALGLNGGIYQVTVSDQNNCTAETTIEVIENPVLALTISGTDISCFGGNDGTATIEVTGGTGVYSFEWNDPSAQTDSVATGLEQGVAAVIVTDSDGCFATADINLTQPDELALDVVFENALCNGSNDGEAAVLVTGGTAPYQFGWSHSIDQDSSLNDLPAGDYTIFVTDVNNCTEEINLTIDEPNAIELNFVPTDVICFGENNGTASVNPSGGTGPYTFQWDANANNQISQIAADLTAGTYFVTVTDANNCSSVSNVDIEQPDALSLSETQVDVLCFGNSTGAIDLTIDGGLTPYSINWNGPNSYTSSNEDINDLFSGVYDVMVTDANGCTVMANYNIDQPATGIMSTMSTPDSICFEAGNGEVSVNVGGGTGPFSYEWNTGATNPDLNNLDGGLYIVTITDSGNCTFIDTAIVVEMEEITVQLAQTGALCHDGSDGTANIESILVGSTSVLVDEYDISWSNGIDGPSSINGLTGGLEYFVTVTDFMGCSASTSIEIDNPEEIGSRVTNIDNTSCFEGSDGSATVNGEGGVAPYTYVWDNNANDQTSATADSLSAGSYNVTITDSNGCSTVTSALVEQPERLNLEFAVEATDCFGDSNGSASSIVQGGTPGYSYAWSNGGNASRIDSIPGGDYSLTITDSNGCTLIETTNVPQPTELEAQIDWLDVNCFGGRDGEISFFPEGGTPPYTYSLDGETYNGSDIQIGLMAGTYPAYIRDARGCEQYLGEYTVNEPELMTVDLGESILIQYGQSTTLNPVVTGGQGTLSYAYDSIDSLSLNCLNCPNPEASPEYTTSYYLIVTDENGCTAEARVTVVVEKDRPVYVPTGFSPNGDGVNDILLVHGKQVERILAFRVYDRWGEMVYEAMDYEYDRNDETAGWDGTFKGSDMNPGVFIWYVEVEYIDGTTALFNGNTTLIR